MKSICHPEKKHKMRGIRTCVAVFFGVLLTISLLMLLKDHRQEKTEQEAFEQLCQQVEQGVQVKSSPVSNVENETQPVFHSPYGALQNENPDFVGWLRIENTNIDYPVMYTPDDPQFYLRRAFDKTDSISGTPFIGANCDLGSDCAIIYGHNMKNGTMFGTLNSYEEKEFCLENPSFALTTLTEVREYEVFAAVKCRILDDDESGFRYYDSSGKLSEAEYAALIEWLVKNALYDTGITPEYGEQILILSTCSYHTLNGRFLLASRRVA